jgi:hypothetical protein
MWNWWVCGFVGLHSGSGIDVKQYKMVAAIMTAVMTAMVAAITVATVTGTIN